MLVLVAIAISPGPKPTWTDDLMFLFRVFNHTLVPTEDGYWAHREAARPGDIGACCNHDITILIRKMSICILRIILRCRPAIPVLSRWTSSGPASDFFILSTAVCKARLEITLQSLSFKRSLECGNVQEHGVELHHTLSIVL